jgi:hypothetical protein
MVGSDPEKSMQMYAMASNFRHVADETRLPRYRTRLLEVARDLEGEAAKLSDHSFLALRSREISRAG